MELRVEGQKRPLSKKSRKPGRGMSNVVAITTQVEEEEWATWDTFWILWPRKEARKHAEKSWTRLNAGERRAAILVLPDWRRVWAARETQYIPLPASWLNGARWEDEIPAEFARTKQIQADNKAFNDKMDKANAERVPMPAHLRALLEEMKRKGRG